MSNAQHFAKALHKEFLLRSSSAAFGEIAQFRALQDAFGALTPAFEVEEYHGAKRQVYFDTTQPGLRPRARCELCDLVVISYSTSGPPEVRLMLLQAKLSKKSHMSLCSSPGIHHLATEFQANFEQWNLLAARPTLLPTKTFAPPPDLLKAAIVPSIGAFGVFHRSSSGHIDMFYASADTLTPAGLTKTKYGKLTTTKCKNIRTFKGFLDAPVCCCLLTFGKALFELRLGTPVVSTGIGSQVIRHEPLVSFVREVLSSYVRGVGTNSLRAREVLSLLGEPDEPVAAGQPTPSLIILKGSQDNLLSDSNGVI